MKKLWKTMLAAGVMSLAASLCMGITAFAATESGTIEGGFTWEVDTASHTLTITGEGELPDISKEYNNGGLWSDHADDLTHVVLNGVTDMYPYGDALGMYFSNAKGQYDNISWEADASTNIVKVTGSGKVTNYPWCYVLKYKDEQKFHYVLSDGITDAGQLGYVTGRIEVGKDFQSLESLKFASESVTISKENPYFASYEGCVYSKDMSKLLYCPYCIEEPILYPQVKTIAAGAFDGNLGALNRLSRVVIPWGVTTIEDDAFSGIVGVSGDGQYVVLPNTITYMTEGALPGKSKGTGSRFIYQKDNQLVDNVLKGKWDSYQTLMAYPVNSLAEYYPDQAVTPAQNGWVQENYHWYYYQNNAKQTGWQFVDNVWYYLGTDGVMQTGWITYNGSTYYLRPWGGMMVNGWYQIDGKWYYFQSWGGTAKSQWLYGLDKKWYYVDANGVMLTNTRTPDGYYVDANGVWVR